MGSITIRTCITIVVKERRIVISSRTNVQERKLAEGFDGGLSKLGRRSDRGGAGCDWW